MCRCSPTQKAQVVTLLKKYAKGRICAIGDGGNDVSMIQAAHVGIGIQGKVNKTSRFCLPVIGEYDLKMSYFY